MRFSKHGIKHFSWYSVRKSGKGVITACKGKIRAGERAIIAGQNS